MTDTSRKWFTPQEMRIFVESVLLKAGVTQEIAEPTARGLWSASMRGMDSHGVRLLPHYVAGVEGGRINPRPSMEFVQTSPVAGSLDADHTFGHAAGTKAMGHAIEMAKESGAGFVGVHNSSHCGAMGYFAEQAAEQDCIGWAMTHATPKMRSERGIRPFFGTNPICFSFPMANEAPYCFDIAPTPFSNNKVKQYAEDGLLLPPDHAADSFGVPVLDPSKATQLLPIGKHKGFALSMTVDIFCSLLTGMAAGCHVSTMYGNSLSEKRCLGQFYGAIRIDQFAPLEVFKQRLQELADELRQEPAVSEDLPVLTPGDPEKQTRAHREVAGLPITHGDADKFSVLAGKFGLTMPEEVSS